MRVAVAGEVMPLSSKEANIRQACPDSGHGFQVNQLKTFKLFPFRSAAGLPCSTSLLLSSLELRDTNL